MALITVDNAELQYGLQVLLDKVSLVVEKGQRWCLIGRNGTGKSSFLKTIAGDVTLDGGRMIVADGVQVARLAQELPEADDRTVFAVVAAGLAETGELLARYQTLAAQGEGDEAWVARLSELQQALEARDGWQLQQRVEAQLSRLGLEGDVLMASLSGGWRRRVALAQALVSDPEVLLLDEPTNHLDIAAIEWLESELKQFAGALIFITHDRSLLQSVATHIAELDRGQLRTWEGDYRSYLDYRERALAEEARHNALFDKKLAEEESWIRQGIKARRTRNEGRVRALKAMRQERQARREQLGNVQFNLGDAQLSGKLVAELQEVSFGWSEKPLIDNFSCRILRGDRIGLVGPNGAGKSTLLKLILGELQPDSGSVRHGTHLQVAYFDQLREQLDLDKNALDNVSEGRESIEINGKARHIMSYLGDFLFSGERARTPLRALSGGERNRVLLARLFSKSANILVLDEPTNDLDVETLELLEEVLDNFAGTVLLVSHDRAFLNNLATSVFAFEGQGQVREYVGGYDDWLRQGGRWVDETEHKPPAVETRVEAPADVPRAQVKTAKLSYKLQREFDALPEQIERLEQRLAELQTNAASPDFYSSPAAEIEMHMRHLAEAQAELDGYYERWAELEDMGG